MKEPLPGILILLALVTGFAATPSSADQPQDEAAIRRVEAGLLEAWNRHDMKVWADLFTEDADFVNVQGRWWKGRAEIEERHAQAHAIRFQESTLSADEVHIKFLTPEIAVVHVLWSLVGEKNPDGSPPSTSPRKATCTQVLQKQAGKWLIAALQNTNSIPGAPIPTPPPKP